MPYRIPAAAGKPYRPSSGTEGMSFYDLWCDQCERDAAFRNNNYEKWPCRGCSIIADSLLYDIDSPHYPKQWKHDSGGVPMCTEFVPRGTTARKAWKTRRENMDKASMYLPFMLD